MKLSDFPSRFNFSRVTADQEREFEYAYRDGGLDVVERQHIGPGRKHRFVRTTSEQWGALWKSFDDSDLWSSVNVNGAAPVRVEIDAQGHHFVRYALDDSPLARTVTLALDAMIEKEDGGEWLEPMVPDADPLKDH